MTPQNLRNPTVGFVAVIAGILTYNAWVNPTPLVLQAAPISVGDTCHRCLRTITDRSIAAEGIGADDGIVRKFKTIACMTKHLRDSGEKLDILVFDRASGRFTQARWATFVRTTVDPAAGMVDYVAFRTRTDGLGFARKTGATPLAWDEVQASERENPLIR